MHQHRGDQAAVGAVVAGEVVVRRVLAAEHGAGLGHDLLDERVTDLRAHRHAAVLADDLGHGPRADQVVQDRAAGRAAQHGGGEDRRRRRAATARRRARRPRTPGRRRRRRPARCRTRRPCTRARRSRWLAGCSGSAGWFGNVPSSSPYMTSSSTAGRRSKTAGTTRPPMPLAVSATTRIGADRVDVDERQHVVDERRAAGRASRRVPARGGVGAGRGRRGRCRRRP